MRSTRRCLSRTLRLAPALLAGALLHGVPVLARAEAAFEPPAGAVHRHGVRYRLPFPHKVPRLLTQGVGGPRSHFEEPEVHAFDFVMPIGSPVLAARAGTVARVADGFREGGTAERFKGTGNTVLVLHDDGTFGIYHHLSPGIPVTPGQRVKAGQRLGRSGNTGYTGGPHLHFAVQRRTVAGRLVSVPIRFGAGRGFVPQPMQFYGSPPRPNATARVFREGRELGPGFHRVRHGERVRLRVEVEDARGRRRDVTAESTTELASMTPWNARLEDGEIVFLPDAGFEDAADAAMALPEGSLASVAVFHGSRGDPVVALTRVEFRIEDGGSGP